MKKFVVFLILIAAVNFSAFSLINDEVWFSFGYEYGTFFDTCSEQGKDVYSAMHSPGINMAIYRFFNKKNVGIFTHSLFAVPKTGYREIDGKFKDYNFYDTFQIGVIMGPGFRYNLTEDFAIRWAVGIDLLMSSIDYKDYLPPYGDVFYQTLRFDYGIGGDLGFKGNINKSFFMSVGTIFTIDFIRFIDMTTSFSKGSSGYAKDYIMASFRPYINVGFNVNSLWTADWKRVKQTPVTNDPVTSETQ